MPVQRIHFNNLPAAVRSHLELYLRGRGPLLSKRRESGVGGVIVACLVALALAGIAYAFANAQLSRYGAIPFAGMLIIGPAIGFPLAIIAAGLASLRRPPFLRGVYVFPTDLVDARGAVWTCTPLHECAFSGEHWISNANDLERLFPQIAPQSWVLRVNGHTFNATSESSLQAALRTIQRAIDRSRRGELAVGDDKFKSVRGTPWSVVDTGSEPGPRYTRRDALAGAATWIGFLVGLAASPLLIVLVNAR
ncbi:hypothetical protein BH11MYX2_BH11MYX2_13670 [soil metagenome]